MYKTFSKFLLILVVVASSYTAKAQVAYSDRVEIEYDRDLNLGTMYNFGEAGILISAVEDLKKSRRDPKRMYYLYDKDLIELERFDVNVGFRRKHYGSFEGEKQLHNFYYDMRKGEYSLVSIDPKKVAIKNWEGHIPSKLFISDFLVLNETLIVKGYLKKKLMVYIVNIREDTYRALSYRRLVKMKKGARVKLIPLTGEGEACIALMQYDKRKLISSELILVDSTGVQAQPINLDLKGNDIVDISLTRLNEGKLLVAGTYNDRVSSFAEGMFFGGVINGRQQFMNTYSFSDFDNFYDYLNPRSRARIEKKVQRRQRMGRSVETNVLMAMHDVEEHEGSYYLLGEVYHPTYRTTTRTTYLNGVPTTTYVEVFDGYQYTHAVLTVFDESGALEEDYSMSMWIGNKPFRVMEFSELILEEEPYRILYVNIDELVIKEVTDGTGEGEILELSGLKSGDRVKWSGGQVEKWFGNTYIAYGDQVIKNTEDRSSKRKRRVFYLQKFELES